MPCARSMNAARRWSRSREASRSSTRRCRRSWPGSSRASASSISAPTPSCWRSTSTTTAPRPISPSPCTSTAIASGTTSQCVRKGCSTRRSRPSSWPAPRASAAPSTARSSRTRSRRKWPTSSTWPSRSAWRESPFPPGTATSMLRGRTYSSGAAPASSSSVTSSSSAASAVRAGRSTSHRCSSISWPATRHISARRGAIRPTTSSVGSGRAICSRTRATRRHSAPSWRRPTGKATASGATASATTAWRIAASRARPWTTRSPIR